MFLRAFSRCFAATVPEFERHTHDPSSSVLVEAEGGAGDFFVGELGNGVCVDTYHVVIEFIGDRRAVVEDYC